MKTARILLLALFSVLLISCASGPQKWAVEKIVVTRDVDGKALRVEETYVPVVPFNFWSTLVDVAVGAGKKAGGL